MEAWVTLVKNEAEVENAGVLGMSLRRVKTGKKIVVLVTPKVSPGSLNKLNRIFDSVTILPTTLMMSDGNLEVFSEAYVMSLTLFKKCVFISANSMVVKNCDEIFDIQDPIAVGFDSIRGVVDRSVFLVAPAKSVYPELPSGDREDGETMRKWWATQDVSHLDSKYNVKIDFAETNKPLGDMSIVNFVGVRPINWKPSNDGSDAESVVTLHRQILDEFRHGPKLESGISLDSSASEPIAVVGLSFRLPGGNSTEELWDLLVNGREAIKPVPVHRWSPQHAANHNMYRSIEAGFLECRVDEADGKFFGWSSAELEYIDPQQRLLHEVVWEALEDAGMDPTRLHSTRTGIFMGTWIHDYNNICAKTPDCNNLRKYLGNSVATTSARLSHFLGTTGPSFGYEVGCSSSFAAIHAACISLRRGESETAIVGGANLILEPFDYSTFGVVLSKDGRCKTFDSSADGFGRAEGVAALVLKKLSSAVRDNDRVWGLIRGTGVTQEGTSQSLGTPTIHSESLAMEFALQDAGIHPKDVTLVEAHGTGTPVGDPIEVAAITKAYSCPERKEPLLITSVKTNVGHTEAVSGLTGLIKVLLSMRMETVPPHRNLNELNPNVNLSAVPAIIPKAPVSWPRNPNKPRVAGISSFGISGGDAHVIVQEPPPPHLLNLSGIYPKERPVHILTLSAKVPEALDNLLEKYSQMLADKNVSNFADIAYSANSGRASFSHRAVVVASDVGEALKVIHNKTFQKSDVSGGNSQPLCFLFTGQGSQYPGMARELYDTSPVFRDHFDYCASLLEERYNISMKDALWGNPTGEMLNRTLYSQTAIFCVEYCLLQLWSSWGVKPDFVLGHSLGEFCAAVAASALTFEDALMLVAERSRLIDALPPGKMLVLKCDQAAAQNLIDSFTKENASFWVDYAALNSEEQTVVAGDSEKIDYFSKFCLSRDIKTIVLAATHAFHSRHMEPMLEAYRKVAATVKPRKTGAKEGPKYISGMEGKLVEVEHINADYWVRHTREPVKFLDACQVMEAEGCSLFLEVGPHPVLSALTKTNLSDVTCLPSISRRESNWTTLLDSVGKLFLSTWKGDIDWKGFDKVYHRTKVDLPKYPFQRKQIWASTPVKQLNLHPLVGYPVPTAMVGVSLFQNELTLKKAPFVSDHVIGNTVVFPGAGFLEMCLSGGNYAIQEFVTGDARPPQKPICVKDLMISNALALNPDTSNFVTIQTVVNLDNSGDTNATSFKISVSSRSDPLNCSVSGNWVQHVKADFVPVASTSQLPSLPPPDMDVVKQSWVSMDTKPFYNQLSDVGLHFGPLFQSLAHAWRNETEAIFKVRMPPQHESTQYLIHPVVTDAMLQSQILLSAGKNEGLAKLQVPVQISHFTWLKPITKETWSHIYIRTWTTPKQEIHSVLFDTSSGSKLAHMGPVDFLQTTATSMEDRLVSSSIRMPMLWSEVWRNAENPKTTSFDLLSSPTPVNLHLTEEEAHLVKNLSAVDDAEREFMRTANQHSILFVLRALLHLGWRPQPSQTVTINGMIKDLKIEPQFKQYLNYFVNHFVKLGWLEVVTTAGGTKQATFRVSKSLPKTLNEVEEMLQVPSEYGSHVEYKKYVEVAVDLSKVLEGSMDPLTAVFPTDPRKTSMNDFYSLAMTKLGKAYKFSCQLILERFQQLGSPESTPNTERSLRVLEIGAGTGAFSQVFFDKYWAMEDNHRFHLEYNYTDISTAFFDSASKRLKTDSKCEILFQTLDIDSDLLHQGFSPDYFDLVIASEVLHVARNISATIERIHKVMKLGGVIFILETVIPHPRRFFTFGLLDGFWHFRDSELRTEGPLLSAEKWKSVLSSSGFLNVDSFPMRDGEHALISANSAPQNVIQPMEDVEFSWLILDNANSSSGDDMRKVLQRKLEGVGRKVYFSSISNGDNFFDEGQVRTCINKTLIMAETAVDRLEGVIYLGALSPDRYDVKDQRLISLPVLTLLQSLAAFKTPPKMVLVTHGACYFFANDSGLINPSAAPVTSLVRGAWNEMPGLTVHHYDLCPGSPPMSQVDHWFHQMWRHKSQQLAFRGGHSHRPKLIPGTLTHNEPLPLPRGCDRFQLILPKTNVVDDLQFTFLESGNVGENEVEVAVHAVALNFRDVFAVIKPSAFFDGVNAVGLDIAGVVSKVGSRVTRWSVGDRVVGLNSDLNLALPSHVTLKDDAIVRLPPSWSLWEGSTILAVFFTAYQCLVVSAKLERGETVLIHTATGGVGLCAIQLCKRLGAKVIATAGSERKRAYLKRLGISHVFHSRTTDFGEQVLRAADGRGVDVILNSLTGPGFKEASLKSLAKGGRFIEMSKLNVWSKEEVRQLRPDVKYTVVDVSSLEPGESKLLADELSRHLEKGILKPLPFERFDAVNIRGALNHLRTGSHIGKLVCVMPTLRKQGEAKAIAPLFHSDSTYIVTGGLSGIGFEVVKWILENGGKHIAILSRRNTPPPEVAEIIRVCNKNGNNVRIFPLDVSNYDHLQNVFRRLKSPELGFPTIRGVFHCAGLLSDGTIENQTWEKFQVTYAPKVDGSWHLHHLTMDYPLEYFVVFSSIVGMLARIGQVNHSASCSFQDALIGHRHTLGLPGTTVNWGNWGEVGVVAEKEFPGLRPISTVQGLFALDSILRTQTRKIGVVNVASFPQLQKLAPFLSEYVENQSLFGEATLEKTHVNAGEQFYKDFATVADKSEYEKLNVVLKFIERILATILRLDAREVINPHLEFAAIGVDSLVMLEMKNHLEQGLQGSKVSFSSATLKNFNTPHTLANHILKEMEKLGQTSDKKN